MAHSAHPHDRSAGKKNPARPPASGAPAGRRPAIEALEDRTLFALAVAPYSPATPAIQLAQRLLLGATGITITGATFQGTEGQAGNFSGFDLASGATRLTLSDGVILTTGSAEQVPGPNENRVDTQGASAGELSTALGLPGDPDLDALAGAPTADVASLTVTFTASAATNSLLFDFVFGSEEFVEFVGSQFNDAFGVYLDGQQVSFDVNGAPITVNNNFFRLNNTAITPAIDPRVTGTTPVNLEVGYDGLTPVIRTQAPLDTSLTTHTIKFTIGDAADQILDSGVFISRMQGSPQVITIPRTEIPLPGSFSISPVQISRRETDLFATVTVTREGGSSGLVAVTIATANGSATAGTDYTALAPTTLVFETGETSQTVTIPIINDTLAEGDESFFVVLSNPTNGAGLTPNFRGEVRIIDDELGVEFVQPEFTVQEDIEETTATITVVLTGPAPSTVTVNYATTTGGTATPGVDYEPVSGTLTFPPGVLEQTFQIPVIDDFTDEETETVNLTLSNVSPPPLTIGQFGTAVLRITNLDRAPAVLDAQFVTTGNLVNGIALTFTEEMDEPFVEDLRNYDLFQRREKKLGGSIARSRYEIISAVYEPVSATVTLTTAKPLRDNKVYEVVASSFSQIQGIRSVDGQPLDGNYDNIEGDDFAGYLTRGTKINYFDEQGDRVTLQLRGPGKMELFRDVERNARQLRMLATDQETILTGSLKRVVRGDISDGVARIDTIFAGNGFRNRLPQPPFIVNDEISGFRRSEL